MANHSLYICYFGLREPLVQTQVLPYLRELKKMPDLKISLLTFEPDFKAKWSPEQIAEEKEKLRVEAINWYVLPYHKSPSVPATLYDIYNGIRLTKKLLRNLSINLIHARVHIPAIIALLARRSSSVKPKVLFDIRGFVPEEYTDAGVWKDHGLIYKVFKRLEKWIMKNSDGFIVLTEKARDVLFPESKKTGCDKFSRPIEVIPCCVDFDNRFQSDFSLLRKKMRAELNIEDRLVITHLGALGGLYLTEEIADFLMAAKNYNPKVFALFLTQTSSDLIVPRLLERGFTKEEFFVGKVNPSEVQNYLAASDVALSFVKSSYATLSRSPTKIPEYLACGIPVISNRGVGDIDELIETDRVGVLIEDFTAESYTKALREVEKMIINENPDIKAVCRQSAKKRFDLEKVGGEKYRNIYKKLFG